MEENFTCQEEDRFLKISNSVDFDYRVNRAEKAQISSFQSIMEWIKRLHGYTTFLYANTLRYKLKHGEVYEIDFGRNVGSELNERHYAVVLHDSNELSQNVIVCPLTTKFSDGGENALINIGRLPGIITVDDSFAKISQIRTVDKVRIYIRPIINHEYNNNQYQRKVGPVSCLKADQLAMITNALNDVLNNTRRI
ncbi:MAG TPA: type II toxin-antitoxin system PemK/MazF family toxin [Bacilli bacterium]|nr:type II toxin-antitoxin system PemK/MazF family toxin [Bacilli bacterium]